MVRKTLISVWLFLTSSIVSAQVGGKKSFEFLNVPGYARLAGLGGVNVSLADRDVNFFLSNPALSGDTLSGMASANYHFYVADVGQSTFTYAHQFDRIGMLSFGIQHLNYGNIQAYDDTGLEIGDYKSGETVLVISKSHLVSSFRLGASVKFAFSNIAGYRASAALLDFGGVFIHPTQQLRVGLVVRNFGFMVSDYEVSSSSLPFDVQVGATFKPEHMPIRFSLTAYNLARKNATYYDPASGEAKPSTLDKVLRRFNFGAEILIHRNINILVGYNYLVHQELKLEEAGGGAGLAFGFSARIKSFEFTLSRGGYVVGNAGYGFTVSKNIDSMLKRKKL